MKLRYENAFAAAESSDRPLNAYDDDYQRQQRGGEDDLSPSPSRALVPASAALANSNWSPVRSGLGRQGRNQLQNIQSQLQAFAAAGTMLSQSSSRQEADIRDLRVRAPLLSSPARLRTSLTLLRRLSRMPTASRIRTSIARRASSSRISSPPTVLPDARLTGPTCAPPPIILHLVAVALLSSVSLDGTAVRPSRAHTGRALSAAVVLAVGSVPSLRTTIPHSRARHADV